MKVAELMTKNVVSIGSHEPASAAAKLMWDCDCGAIPVVENQRVVGMITDRDICMAAWMRDQPLSHVRASEVMSRALFYCSPSDTVGVAENLMRSKQIRRLPVVDDLRQLVGILSLADIVRGADGGAIRGTSNELDAQEIMLTLSRICRPPQAAGTSPSVAASSRL